MSNGQQPVAVKAEMIRHMKKLFPSLLVCKWDWLVEGLIRMKIDNMRSNVSRLTGSFTSTALSSTVADEVGGGGDDAISVSSSSEAFEPLSCNSPLVSDKSADEVSTYS